jgi:hypothetical protein
LKLNQGSTPMNERRLPGKPRAAYIQNAVAMIQVSSHPLSTQVLIERFNLNRNQAMTLRRGLRRAAASKAIMLVGRAGDGSYAWARGLGESSGHENATLGAAYAAEVYLRACLGPVALDIDACRRVIASTLIVKPD